MMRLTELTPGAADSYGLTYIRQERRVNFVEDLQTLQLGRGYIAKFIIRNTSLISALRQVSFVGEMTSRDDKPASNETIVGKFLPGASYLSFTAVVQQKFTLQFRLLPDTRTYRSFIRFLYAELTKSLLAKKNTAVAVRKSFRLKCAEDFVGTALLREMEKFDDRFPAPSSMGPESAIEVYPADFLVLEDENLTPLLRDRHHGRKKLSAPEINKVPSPLPFRRIIRRQLFQVFHRDDSDSTVLPATVTLMLEELAAAAPASAGRSLRSSISLKQSAVQSARDFRFLCTPEVKVATTGVETNVKIEAPESIFPKLEFFVRWGKYGSGERQWVDQQIDSDGIADLGNSMYRLKRVLRPATGGRYGVTFYARYLEQTKKYWLGRPYIDDGQFYLDTGYSVDTFQNDLIGQITQLSYRTELTRSMLSFEEFVKTIYLLSSKRRGVGLGKILFEITRDDPALRQVLAEYHDQAVERLSRESDPVLKKTYQMVVTTLQNIGIGEIVFIAPEGPHANAGGLGQVIIGLMQSLNRCGISTTLITPLYEQNQGNKHKAAEKLLRDGLRIQGRTVEIHPVGKVPVTFGPTMYSGTPFIKEPPLTCDVEVYLAEYENLRMFFLRHKRFAHQLYPTDSSDEQLRRAIYLSRGAIELLTRPQFGVTPHILITNDWLAGLVPMLLKTDPAYAAHAALRGVETVHILHNCGRTYQGRLFVNQFGEDLWPMLGLTDEHFFGLADPNDKNYFNLTAGAIFHVGRALVAVSKPYAQELFTKEGGEGLHELLQQKARLVFGISNGVDLQALRHIFWELGENAASILEDSTFEQQKYSEDRLLKRLPRYKEALKTIVQRKSGLVENDAAVLISLVGRLAEQKGIGLLTQKFARENLSVLEAILRTHPRSQIIIAGPPSENDPMFLKLVSTLRDLVRRYPGRIQGIFDFVPHGEALQITGASDLFLMPSRYEPGGITQLEALATGTLVVARNVGGISATLNDYDATHDRGNAFLFEDYTPQALLQAIFRGIEVCRDRKSKKQLMLRAAVAENDWAHRAPKYLSLLQYVAGVFSNGDLYPYLSNRKTLLTSIRPEDVEQYRGLSSSQTLS